jgi:hypothetical protein
MQTARYRHQLCVTQELSLARRQVCRRAGISADHLNHLCIVV